MILRKQDGLGMLQNQPNNNNNNNNNNNKNNDKN